MKSIQKSKSTLLQAALLAAALPVAAQHSDYPIQPVDFTHVHLTDHFWARQDPGVNADVTIPYTLDQCRRTGRIDNFSWQPGKMPPTKYTEYPFDDTDIYESNEESLLWSCRHKRILKLELYLDTLIRIIADAQEADGYLYTFRTVKPARSHMNGSAASDMKKKKT